MRLLDLCHSVDRRLVMPLAGYPGLQLTRSTIKQNEFNAELQARSLYKLVDRTLPDAVFTMMDLSVEAGAIGLPVRFPIGDSATIEWHPVKRIADLDQYKVLHPLYDGRVWVFRETLRLLTKRLQIPVGTYVIGPFSLAGLLIGANDIALATIEKPGLVHATMNFCEHVVVEYAKALQDAGATMICILDPTAVILSPDSFEEFAGRGLKHVVDHLDTRTMLHVCGDTTHLIGQMCETGVQGLSLDSQVDLPGIAPRVDPEVVIIGNVDPVWTMLKGTPDDVRKAVRSLLDAMKGHENFIMSTGCDLPAETPIENIRAMCDAVKEYG